MVLAGSLPDGAALAQDGPQRCGELPPAVAEKRRAILAAADSDPEDLAALTDPQEFTSNYGGEEMLAYWQWLAEEVDIRDCEVAPSSYLDGPEAGYHIGWFIFISEDGDWIALVAGD